MIIQGSTLGYKPINYLNDISAISQNHPLLSFLFLDLKMGEFLTYISSLYLFY